MAVIITKSTIVAHVDSRPAYDSDGNVYIVRETGFKTEHEKVAINNAFSYIRKQVRRMLRLMNKARPKGSPVILSLPRVYENAPVKRIRTIPPKIKRIRTKFY